MYAIYLNVRVWWKVGGGGNNNKQLSKINFCVFTKITYAFETNPWLKEIPLILNVKKKKKMRNSSNTQYPYLEM